METVSVNFDVSAYNDILGGKYLVAFLRVLVLPSFEEFAFADA
jgi:hypothetical protein